MRENNYSPNIAIHPGRTLQDILESLRLTQVDLAQRTGLTAKTINEIVQGKSSITPDTAMKLSVVFGMSTNFWNNLQRGYEETLSRLKVEEKLEEESSLLGKFVCYSELVKWGYIQKTRDKKEKVRNLLNFFGINSLELVQQVHAIAFRKTKQKGVIKESLAAWLRCGELEAQKINVQKFNHEKVLQSLDILRSLTKENPETFQKKLIDICSSYGIAVAFVPYFKKTYVNGMTRWFNSDNALIQLSLRGSYDDIFWFTFFHELAHLLKHGKKEQFVEFENEENKNLEEKEREADDFACHTLIPKDEYTKFVSQNDFSVLAIKNFAVKLNISPSIVAGRLSYENNDWKTWAFLRKRLKFQEKNN